MSSLQLVDLFIEDRAHEAFLVPLVRRVASEVGVDVDIQIRSARGGHARAIEEFRTYQKLVAKGALEDRVPNLIVVGIDGNCASFPQKRKEIEGATTADLRGCLVSACPDPHIERWLLADPESFQTVVGHRPVVGKAKCIRDHYKGILAQAVRKGGHQPTLGGVEFASELVAAMDLYRAGKADRSLKAFLDELRGALMRGA